MLTNQLLWTGTGHRLAFPSTGRFRSLGKITGEWREKLIFHLLLPYSTFPPRNTPLSSFSVQFPIHFVSSTPTPFISIPPFHGRRLRMGWERRVLNTTLSKHERLTPFPFPFILCLSCAKPLLIAHQHTSEIPHRPSSPLDTRCLFFYAFDTRYFFLSCCFRVCFCSVLFCLFVHLS